MKRYLLLLLALLVLAACGASEPPVEATPADTEMEEEATAVIEEAAVVPEESEDTETESESVENEAPVADTGDYSFATTVEEASLVRAEDHFLGTDDPAVTIIEYGDFQ